MSQAKPSSFYKYATASTGRIILQSRSLRWSTPALFNDPYDTQFDLHVDGEIEEVRRLSLEKLWEAWYSEAPYIPHPGNIHGQLIAQFREKFPRMTREEFAAEMIPAIDEGFERATRALPSVHQEIRSLLAKSKILCQSSVWDSLPMWSYYADNHRGVVLCFKVVPELDSPWEAARPVLYSDVMPRMGDVEFFSDLSAGLTSLDPKILVDRIVYTKAAEWAHEREWRLQAGSGRNPDAAFEDIPFHPLELDAVILGCAMLPDDRVHLIEIVNVLYPHARLLAACKHDREFRLTVENARQDPAR
ncbi:DUF2971 domain-containing protein [Reyranella sp.]|jgi:hypothetical protein|uniref:DUF2971 domain-containing protein n=1 Tax=Reyranella sp. TaxID=1929291 RepID=UPI000BDDA102|nr:DUF2971 domain-containing protein [Reyranella sp.]OYY34949.1 MAG: hypothetical protein B7Y57_27470 [Rhodospirillales bacterium 35-66-84]OYZ91373.1 MAG: hypothetical protein B7Y08_26675 [Rhodospirillales bacterium 24-66-33]OZB21432.1 MAG: hypothetical protein B7X63_27715 [Rhodospirillales bacterium 39-66-50]HQS18238.1 DUF2971 domain-containing protein [Reyranella sp.]HQT14696.1 DUF2971 domain-containing protein [Reyranella sp.]